MFDPTRCIASSVYLASLACTLFAAFKLRMALMVLVAVVVQFAAFLWYCASYVPYGRAMLSGCFFQAIAAVRSCMF